MEFGDLPRYLSETNVIRLKKEARFDRLDISGQIRHRISRIQHCRNSARTHDADVGQVKLRACLRENADNLSSLQATRAQPKRDLSRVPQPFVPGISPVATAGFAACRLV